jgi:GT2 family glycosyltransferase
MTRTTIIVTPRERLHSIVWSLESLFATISDDVPVIVVDGGIPPGLRQELDRLQSRRPFRHISHPYQLTPNQARNLGNAAADTEFVVFADNDIIYERNWLEALEDNATRTGAGVVAPLICNGPPAATTIHHAGGLLTVYGDPKDPTLNQHHRLMDAPIAGWNAAQAPEENEIAEFHCLMARRDTLERIGPLDERLTTREPVDFALRLKLAGEKVTFEHGSVVTYMRTEKMDARDLPYFLFRWSEPLAVAAIDAFEASWGVKLERQLILNNWIGWHRKKAVRSCFPRLRRIIGKKRFDRIIVRWWEQRVNAANGGHAQVRTEPQVPANPDRARVLDLYRTLIDRPLPPARVPLSAPVGRARLSPDRTYDLVGGAMSTMPTRHNTAPEAIRSVIGQVDRLYLFLDGFDQVPDYASDPKIVAMRSQDRGDLKAKGKYLALSDLDRPALFFTFDDDILYPEDYVARLREDLAAYGYDAAVGVHGSVLTDPLSSYLTDRAGSHRSAARSEDGLVDILGVDTLAFATDRLNFDVTAWKMSNMLDLCFACEAARQGVPMISVRRKADWVKGLASNQPDSIYRGLTEDDSVQTGLAKTLIAYKQGRKALEAAVGGTSAG